MFDKLIDQSRAKSPWIFHLNAGSCNGCDIELIALLGPNFDAERFGVKLTGTPRHADIVFVTGPITSQSRERMQRVLAQVPDPKVIVSLGSCPISGNVFKGSYSIEGPLDKWVHVDVAVGGCPPKPEAMMDGLLKAIEILNKKRGEE
ncbi:NADH-quinone oxidoreductase subunit B family protein [Clostridium thermarum]|uniref:NADH-quinone oxidoreductase subunit B family protein n=1 Tax=Clostridium thermarum TaxID=1716543 RepID=UPI0013D790A9|nr:NADH-quinone oxidoreductase subunit NuoB [Clostridium thermarum]